MPSTSKKQHNFMAAVAHSKEFAKKAGVPQSVGKDFMEADKGKKFRMGGTTNPMKAGINKPQTHHGKLQMPNVSLKKYRFKEGGETMKHDDVKQDKAMIKKAVGMHDKQLHGGKKTNLTKLARGGGVEVRGKTKGTMIKMCGGGMKKSSGRGR